MRPSCARRSPARSGVTADRVTVGAGSVGLLQQLALSYLDRGDRCRVLLAVVRGVSAVRRSRRGRPDHPAAASPDVRSRRARRRGHRRHEDGADRQPQQSRPARSSAPTSWCALVERVPDSCLVVVDEAYAEFVTDPRITDSMALLDRFPNVLVLRTFSKAHALAALRIGYAVGHPDVIAVLDRTLVPFVVNGLGQRAAIASLAAARRDARARGGRRGRALRRWPPRCDVPGGACRNRRGTSCGCRPARRAADVGVGLERLGVVTRVFPDVGVRVTIGDAAANARFLEAFEKVAVELDAGAWQLPTGDLAVRIAGHLDELDDVLARLEAHATAAVPSGLTEPDAGGTERWDAGQVWAHLAEFGSYWRAELRSDRRLPGRRRTTPGAVRPHQTRPASHRHDRRAPARTDRPTVRRRCVATSPRFRADLAELTRRRLGTAGSARDARRDGPVAVPRPLRHRPLRRARRPTRRAARRESAMADDRPDQLAAAGRRRRGSTIPPGSPFPLHNLPFGVGRRPTDRSVRSSPSAIGRSIWRVPQATGLLDGTWGRHGLLGADGIAERLRRRRASLRTPRCASA